MRNIYIAVSLSPIMLQGGLVFGQDRLETVTVTTTSLNSDAEKSVGNVGVLHRGDLVDAIGSNLGDSLTEQAGVNATQFGQGASRPVLRGLGEERVLVLTNGAGVIDASAASPDHQVSADALDAERIEILRGPEALAYGGQAVGGIVNVLDGLISTTPLDESFEAEGLYIYDSVNEGQTAAGRVSFQNGPIKAVISLSARDLDNYEIPGFAESPGLRALEAAESEENDDHEEEEHDEHEEEVQGIVANSFTETSTVAGGLTWSQDGSYFGVSFRQQTSDYGILGHGHREHAGEEHEDEGHDDDHQEEEYEEHGEDSPFIALEQTRFMLQTGHEFDRDHGLTHLNASLVTADYNHTEFEVPGEPGTLYDASGTEGRVKAQFSHDNTQYVVGANFIDSTLTATGEEAFLPATETQAMGAFVLRQWENDAGLNIDGGLRLESIKSEAATGASAEFTATSASISGSKTFEGDVLAGAQISVSQRAPSVTELFSNGEHLATQRFELGDANLDTETSLNFEVTGRKNLGNGRVGANIFYNNFSDFIYQQSLTVAPAGVDWDGDLPLFQYSQEDAEFIGGEIYADYHWDDAILGADIHADLGLDFLSANLSNSQDVPLIPPVRLLFGVHAEWNAAELGTHIVFAGEQSNPGAGQLSTDGYTDVAIEGRLKLGHWLPRFGGTYLLVEVENLLDEEIRYATSVTKDLAPQPGQNIRIGLRAKF